MSFTRFFFGPGESHSFCFIFAETVKILCAQIRHRHPAAGRPVLFLGDARLGLLPGSEFSCRGTFVKNSYEIDRFRCLAVLPSGRIISADEKVSLPIPMLFGTEYYLSVGYGTEELPAFYSRHSGLQVDYRMDTPEEIAATFLAQRRMGLKGGMLVTNPIPEEYAMDDAVINGAIDQAVRESVEQGIKGKEITPFLLARVSELTGGDSLDSNIQLVFNNARLASAVAAAYQKMAKE